ncbi:MAG: S41 family peptidase, partial [Candidatus Peribacteraceae bacterium]|nr:S41 family peptidase [Candidatus Peribacteraceae bacterium]
QIQPMLFGAAAGLVHAVGDPYTSFMTPNQNEDFHISLQGKLEGIGAQLTMRENMIVVIAPMKGSPAQDAGLLPEDIIVVVDDEDITGEDLNQVVNRIRGPRGTKVVLGVIRKGVDEIVSVSITRDEIKIPSTEYSVKDTASGSIGIITINQFGDSTTRDTEKALRSILKEDDLIGVILDVRFNGGGYLERAVEMVSLFVQQGEVVSVVRMGEEAERHFVNGRPLSTDIPLVILVNEGSASASEILAGALQDHDRAEIIGKKTFGKGTVQEIFELPGGSSLRITIAKWHTPNGRDLSKEGIDPDKEVERTMENINAGEDPQMEAAVDYFMGKTMEK